MTPPGPDPDQPVDRARRSRWVNKPPARVEKSLPWQNTWDGLQRWYFQLLDNFGKHVLLAFAYHHRDMIDRYERELQRALKRVQAHSSAWTAEAHPKRHRDLQVMERNLAHLIEHVQQDYQAANLPPTKLSIKADKLQEVVDVARGREDVQQLTREELFFAYQKALHDFSWFVLGLAYDADEATRDYASRLVQLQKSLAHRYALEKNEFQEPSHAHDCALMQQDVTKLLEHVQRDAGLELS